MKLSKPRLQPRIRFFVLSPLVDIVLKHVFVSDVGHCPACSRKVCTKLRTAHHESMVCSTNVERDEVLKLTEYEKWQLCYQ